MKKHEMYGKRRALLNEASVEQRAIRDCKKKIEHLLAKDPERDISFQKGTLANHQARYEEIIQEVSRLELDILTERSGKILNNFA